MKRIVCILALTGLCSCSGTDRTTPQTEERTAPVITMAEAAPERDDSAPVDGFSGATAVPNEVSFNGTLVLPPQAQASVSLSMDGIVRSTPLLPGAYVRKGTVIATLENPDFVELQQAYLEAAAQLDYLEAEYHRQRNLAREEAASQKRLEQSKAEYLSMKSRREAAAARLSMLGVDPARITETGILPLLEVTAPINGYVADMRMNTGKHVTAGEPLCEIIDKSGMLVRLTAYEKDLNQIAAGDAIEFRVNGVNDQAFTGKILSVGHQVDPVNRSIEVYASVNDKNPVFRPGMYVNARITAPAGK